MENDVKQISIVTYLKERGIAFEQRGNKQVCSSPFARDSNWSFYVYPGNTFYDWSMGFGGTIIDLVMRMEGMDFLNAVRHLRTGLFDGEFTKYKPNYKETRERVKKDFSIDRFVTTDPYEILTIDQYAHSRHIRHEYLHGKFFQRKDDNWIEILAMMFPHRDKDMKIIGARFRAVPTPTLIHLFGTSKMFSSRGTMGWYVLTYVNDFLDDPYLFIVESETSANSLWEYCKQIDVSCVVLSAGSVGTIHEIPDEYKSLSPNIIIDYDGDEKLFKERASIYEDHFDSSANIIKLVLEKGEDINSLYSSNQMFKIENLLF